jgi:hypothetical protein
MSRAVSKTCQILSLWLVCGFGYGECLGVRRARVMCVMSTAGVLSKTARSIMTMWQVCLWGRGGGCKGMSRGGVKPAKFCRCGRCGWCVGLGMGSGQE